MSPVLSPLLVVLAAAPATFTFELRGVPVGEVTLAPPAGPGTYRYVSRQLFTRDTDRTQWRRTATLRVDASGTLPSGEHPVSLWLLRRPAALGCVQGAEELGGRKGRLCLQRRDGARDDGEVLGQPYVAMYEDGELQSLTIAEARFVRRSPDAPPLRFPPDLFARGVPVTGEGNTLALDPPIEAPSVALPRWNEASARALAVRVRASFDRGEPSAADFRDDGQSSGSCLAHALRYVAWARGEGAQAVVVHGVLVEPGTSRAYPHAWVRVARQDGRPLDLDPATGLPVSARTHLALGVEGDGAGSRWLDVLTGRLRVVRR